LLEKNSEDCVSFSDAAFNKLLGGGLFSSSITEIAGKSKA